MHRTGLLVLRARDRRDGCDPDRGLRVDVRRAHVDVDVLRAAGEDEGEQLLLDPLEELHAGDRRHADARTVVPRYARSPTVTTGVK